MKLRMLAGLAVGLLLGAGAAAKGDDKKGDTKDLDAMQGTWEIASIEQAGMKVPAEEIKKANVRLVIKGDKFTYKMGDTATGEGSFKLDPEKKTLDATGKGAGGKEEKTLGIYELKGDELRVCFVPEGETRPTKFEAKEGTKAVIITYKRVKDKE
jgi:uncharacterized protein (TIGR03067 family)